MSGSAPGKPAPEPEPQPEPKQTPCRHPALTSDGKRCAACGTRIYL
ncbi:hypothetical protein [Streptomyces xiaopingdaonensis]|nr:hypothetical protein [Streptomyces xiaopingdaonensis]